MTTSFDAVVIGGGIVGGATAFHLAGLGARVALIERGAFGAEASGRNAGTLNLIDDRSAEFSGLAFRQWALEQWRLLPEALGHDLELVLDRGTLLVAEQDSELARLRELQAGHLAQGVAMQWLDGADLRAFAPYLAADVPAAIFSPVGGGADPRRVGEAYAQAAARRGVTLLRGTEVTAIHRQDDAYKIGSFCTKIVVVAAGPWSATLVETLGTTLPLRIRYFQASVTEKAPPFLLHGLRRVGGMLTLKQTAGGRCVLGGGWVGHGAFPVHGAVSSDALAANRAIASRLVPRFANLPVKQSWAGYDGSSIDGEPILDQVPGWPGVVVATGASAGFLYGPAIGQLTAEYALGLRTSRDISRFALSRFAPESASARPKETLTGRQ